VKEIQNTVAANISLTVILLADPLMTRLGWLVGTVPSEEGG